MAIINEYKMFGDIFKDLRLEQKMSQDKIAEELDVSQPLIAKWESHQSTPAPEMLDYIADYFNISTDYLLGRSKYRNLEFNNSELDNILIDKIKQLSEENKIGVLSVVNLLSNNTINIPESKYSQQIKQFGDENNIKIQIDSKKELTENDANLIQSITESKMNKND